MEEMPLTSKEFEQAKLIVNTKYTDDIAMEVISKWTYEQYLLSRWHAKKCVKGDRNVCAIDPTHPVKVYYDNARIIVNCQTGAIEILERDYDDWECETCLGRKKQFIIDCDGELEEFELLANQLA